MRTPPLLADFIHSRACKPICAKSLTLPNSTAGTPIFLSVACSVVNALTTYFNQAKTSRKAKQNRPFQLKRAVFVKLDSNLDIFRSCERFRKCTQPAFWLAALLRRTNVLAEGQNLGAGQLYFA